jgi:hypothetical protein
MRKIYYSGLFIFLLILIADVAVAQTHIGVKGGRSFSEAGFTPSLEIDHLAANNFGLVFTHVEKGIAGIIVEVNYIQKGFVLAPVDLAYRFYNRLDYVEVPFLTHLTFGRSTTKFVLNFGPYVGFLLDTKEVFINNREGVSRSEIGLHGDYNKMDFGLAGGIGIIQSLPIGTFLLEGRFSHGFMDIYQFNPMEGVRASQNQVLNFSIAYLIPLRKESK